MIHKAFNKSIVAMFYYVAMGKVLNKQEAVKKFIQDKNIDKAVLSLVLSNIFEAQKKLLKNGK